MTDKKPVNKKPLSHQQSKGYEVKPGETWADIPHARRVQLMRERASKHLQQQNSMGGLKHELTVG